MIRNTFRRGLLIFVLLSSCTVATPPHPPKTPPEQLDFTQVERLRHLLPEYSDDELRLSLRKAEEQGRLRTTDGSDLRQQINALLASRFRQQYQDIPDQLWERVKESDWIKFLYEPASAGVGPEGERILPFAEASVGGAQLTGAHTEEVLSVQADHVTFTQQGSAIHVPAATVAVGDLLMTIPEINYLPPRPGENILESTAAILSRHYGKNVQLGEPFAHGAMRSVFANAADPDTIVKVYLPEKMAKIHASAPFKFPLEAFTAYFLQRDLALQDFLLKARQKYLDNGLKPPFDIALIDVRPEFIERGIIVQQKAKGLRLWKDLPDGVTRQRLSNLNRYFTFHRLYDEQLFKLISARYGIFVNVRSTEASAPRDIGLDWGEKFSNLFLQDDGTPTLIDW